MHLFLEEKQEGRVIQDLLRCGYLALDRHELVRSSVGTRKNIDIN